MNEDSHCVSETILLFFYFLGFEMLFVCLLEDVFLPSYLSFTWENFVRSAMLENQEFTEWANWTEKGMLTIPKIWGWITEPVKNIITNSILCFSFLWRVSLLLPIFHSSLFLGKSIWIQENLVNKNI